MSQSPIIQLPGVGSTRTATPRHVLLTQEGSMRLPNIGVIDGSESRDAGNTGDLDKLRAGVVMGLITSSSLWAPSFVGVTTANYTSGGVSLTVSAATATELNRLASVGASGTSEMVCIGAPTAGGTVASTAFDHSAIDTSTGVITVTSLGVDKIAGSIVAVNDGRATPLGILPGPYPIKVTDLDANSVDRTLGDLLIGGAVDINQIVNYPTSTNTTLVAWLKAQLRLAGPWAFSDDFS